MRGYTVKCNNCGKETIITASIKDAAILGREITISALATGYDGETKLSITCANCENMITAEDS